MLKFSSPAAVLCSSEPVRPAPGNWHKCTQDSWWSVGSSLAWSVLASHICIDACAMHACYGHMVY
jgi:hypothetical protein